MKYLTLEMIKSHSRIQFDCEDDLLQLYAESAEDTVLNMLNRSYDDLIAAYGEVPKPVIQATLMLVDNSYINRSPVSPQQMYMVPYTIDVLLKPYIIL